MILYLVRDNIDELFSGNYGTTTICHESTYLIRDGFAGHALVSLFDLEYQTSGMPHEIEQFIRGGR